MQSHYEADFMREMGCSEAEWLTWLPRAMGEVPWSRSGRCVQAALGPQATLALSWAVAEPRVLGLARIPRLHMRFRFDGADAAQRLRFMRRFDLYTQRGGG